MTHRTGKPGHAEPSSAIIATRMQVQRRRDTLPELAVRRLLFANGTRFRVNHPVPGLPRRSIDIAFTRARIAVFIDGCFWHGCPMHGTTPKANRPWWARKLAANQARDASTSEHLIDHGWRVLRFWEHENPADVVARILEDYSVITESRATNTNRHR